LKEENQDQVELFLASHPDFELIDAAPILAARTSLVIDGPYLSLRPDVHGTDGFFAAIFERKKALVTDKAKSEPAFESETETEVLLELEVQNELVVQEILVPPVDTQTEAELKVKPKAKPRAKPKAKAKVKDIEKPQPEDASGT
jgi:16S rRNA (cytosine967-C5)-methyltransferase